MTTLYLKYGTWSSGVCTWSTSQTLNALKFIEITNTDRIKGRDLRGTDFNHLLSTRKIWDVLISADELATATKFTFIKNWHKAHTWKFSLNNWTSETLIEVEGGDIPIEFIENNKNLPSYSAKFTQRDAD